MAVESLNKKPSSNPPVDVWRAAVDYFQAKMAGRSVVFVADNACTQGLRAYLSQAKLPVQFALFYSRALGMSKSILAQRLRHADWLIVGAEAEAELPNCAELTPERAAVRVLIADKPINPSRDYDFYVCANTAYSANGGEQVGALLAKLNQAGPLLTLADGSALVNASAPRLNYLKQQIAHTYAKRAELKAEMEAWYQAGKGFRFPRRFELESIDRNLSQLDTAYKRLWDAKL